MVTDGDGRREDGTDPSVTVQSMECHGEGNTVSGGAAATEQGDEVGAQPL